MKTVDLYVRVSTDEQADKGYSQRSQEEYLQKYAAMHSLTVRKVIYEDHSAKTFNRPRWNEYLTDLRKKKGQSDAVLFVKWDRFSRNIAEAYQMISTLRKLGVEPFAIEQPLDLNIPENKIMLAFYLAAPEVENDRRALNVFHGQRRARLEGRFMGPAPLGYINKHTEDGKKYITAKEPEAGIIRWIFETIATGQYSAEEVLNKARQKGLKCSKNNYWWLLRNPLYTGKITVPAFKDEPMKIVEGQHKGIISESLFQEVQDVLNGRKKVQRTKMLSDEMLPLRGFLTCPTCGKTLTGSASRGRNARYYYYHCVSSCGNRFKAEEANAAFVEEIKKYTPHPAVVTLYREVVSEAYNRDHKAERDERKAVLAQMDEQNCKLSKARELLLSDAIEPADYKAIKAECEEELRKLEAKLSSAPPKRESINEVLEKACQTLGNLDVLYLNGTVEQRRRLIGSIFPEKLCFDESGYRTARLNEAVRLIYKLGTAFSEKEKGQTGDFTSLSHQVIRLGLEPRAHTLKVYCSTN